MGWRTLETAAWLALYGGILIFLCSWNSASSTYNEIFRDRTSSDWLPGRTRTYEPGTRILGTTPSPYFAGGWWRSEAALRWGRGTQSRLVIEPAVDIDAGARIVTHFAIFPLRAMREYPVNITVNGERIAQIVAGSEQERHEITVPFALPAGRPTTIAFESQFSKSPLSQGYGLDQRELGVQFLDLTVLMPE